MPSELNMDYNSQLEILKISEYGRNIQNLIGHCKTIEDPEYRQAFAEKIISLMWQMNPNSGPRDDVKRKFWSHLMLIADYDLDVKIPEGIEIVKLEERSKEANIEYPSKNKRMRQYGKNVQTMIAKALVMEDEAKRNAYIRIIGSFMKLAYKNWSREHYVNDEAIKADLLKLSDGKLSIPDGIQFDLLKSSMVNKKPRDHKKGGKGKGKSYQNRKRR